jgi:xanthosine utilization system XapX-like protein
MPTIFRFALICAVVAGVAYAALYALATVLEPAPREITVVVPPSRYAK